MSQAMKSNRKRNDMIYLLADTFHLATRIERFHRDELPFQRDEEVRRRRIRQR